MDTCFTRKAQPWLLGALQSQLQEDTLALDRLRNQSQ